MSIPVYCSRSQIFSEFSFDEQKNYFGLFEKKFLPEIDNFYYMVFLDEIHCQDSIDSLILELEELYCSFDYKSGDKVNFHGLDFYPFGLKGYNYRLSMPECFDILVRSSLPNNKTPRIWVQLRARYLWLNGTRECLKSSFTLLLNILNKYCISVAFLQENRVDYCFHTNSIQNPEKFFDRPKLMKHCKTRASIYNLVGNPQNNWSVDYCSIGSRRSSVFFRVYNKSREVVEQNYKAFFIKKWFDEGLISFYDKYCYEYAFKLKSYDIGLIVGQINWYLEYGKNEQMKDYLFHLMEEYFVDNSNSNKLRRGIEVVLDKYITVDDVTYVKNIVLNILPPVTKIINIEYETHRDFYRSFEESLSSLYGEIDVGEGFLKRLNLIYECRKSFVDYLTCFGNTVSFVKDNNMSYKDFIEHKYGNDYLSFWKRLRSSKWKNIYKPELYRKYERNVDIDLMKRKILSDVATLSIHKNGINTNSLTDDISDALGTLNDNDMQNIVFVDNNSGEVLDVQYGDYSVVKKRKNRQYRSIVSNKV